ncbi:unnamed protein product [Lasius platythorax]|uniref:Uncharacterized protein n=1 Tax=Lasius platythorax TaxID=488582 RepID=A0AAV2NE60_9HYME
MYEKSIREARTSSRNLCCLENRSLSFPQIFVTFFCFTQPFKPEFSDLDYADVDYKSYGPINYKAASIALLQKQHQQQQLQQQQAQQQQRLLNRRPQMYGASDDNEELL